MEDLIAAKGSGRRVQITFRDRSGYHNLYLSPLEAERFAERTLQAAAKARENHARLFADQGVTDPPEMRA